MGGGGNINIVIMFHEDINYKDRVKFRFKAFFGSSLNDAGILFQMLAPILEKALFCVSSRIS